MSLSRRPAAVLAERVDIAFGRASIPEIEILSGSRARDRLVIQYPARFGAQQRASRQIRLIDGRINGVDLSQAH